MRQHHSNRDNSAYPSPRRLLQHLSPDYHQATLSALAPNPGRHTTSRHAPGPTLFATPPKYVAILRSPPIKTPPKKSAPAIDSCLDFPCSLCILTYTYAREPHAATAIESDRCRHSGEVRSLTMNDLRISTAATDLAACRFIQSRRLSIQHVGHAVHDNPRTLCQAQPGLN